MGKQVLMPKINIHKKNNRKKRGDRKTLVRRKVLCNCIKRQETSIHQIFQCRASTKVVSISYPSLKVEVGVLRLLHRVGQEKEYLFACLCVWRVWRLFSQMKNNTCILIFLLKFLFALGHPFHPHFDVLLLSNQLSSNNVIFSLFLQETELLHGFPTRM